MADKFVHIINTFTGLLVT